MFSIYKNNKKGKQMKTFKENILAIKNKKLILNLTEELDRLNIDSETFLDWFVDKDIYYSSNLDFLLEGFFDNINTRFQKGKMSSGDKEYKSPGAEKFGKKVGNWVQNTADKVYTGINKAQNAYNTFSNAIAGDESGQTNAAKTPSVNPNQETISSLVQLDKRLKSSPELQNKISDPDFSNRLLHVINYLKNTKHENYNQNIDSVIQEVIDFGVSPDDLVNWYLESSIEEGFKDWISKAGNWVKNQWHNAKNAVNNWNDGSKKMDAISVEKALQSLKNIKGEYPPDFIDQVNNIKSILSNMQK